MCENKVATTNWSVENQAASTKWVPKWATPPHFLAAEQEQFNWTSKIVLITMYLSTILKHQQNKLCFPRPLSEKSSTFMFSTSILYSALSFSNLVE